VRLLKLLWALPCSLVGLVLALAFFVARARARVVGGAFEVVLRPGAGALAWLPFRCITFGHVILAIDGADLERLRAHEQVHVRQYERWGVLFFVLYAASSAWQLLRGGRPYWDNHFEVQARQRSGGR
jgi:hypothetical protein